MSIVRVERNSRERFTIVDNRTIEDQRLSWETLGLLIWLLSKPDGWQISRAGIISQRKTGTDRLTRMMKELEDAGYLTRNRSQHATGGFAWENVVHERPLGAWSGNPTMPSSGKPSIGKPSIGNPMQVKTEIVKTEVVKTENTGFEGFWSLYPKKTEKRAAEKAWSKLKPNPELQAAMLARLRTFIAIDWKYTEKQFMPNPATWLNGARWEDEVIQPKEPMERPSAASFDEAARAEHYRKHPTADELAARRNGSA